MNKPVEKHWYLLICACLALVTLAIYLPVRNHEFIHYDDDTYVTDNPHVLSGLTIENIRWAFTTPHGANWHPLTWLSHMLDCSLFGKTPGPHHLINVIFHIANTLLLFVVLHRMTKRIWPSAFVAALFALHPLHVESVAWVAERKDVLSTLFWLLTILAYARYAERPNLTRYLLTLAVFALGLMTKPMLVTLPFVLLLLDYWPLERFKFDELPDSRTTSKPPTINYRLSIISLLLEKLPFLLLTGISSIITFIVQQKGGSVPSFASLGFKSRLTNAVVSYLAYIGKMIYPTRLAVLYPHPAGGIPVARAIIFGVLLLLMTAFFLYHARRHRYLALGWLWYLGTLVPVIGIVQVGVQAMADRYTYVPLIGLFLIVAFGAADLLKNLSAKKYILAASAFLVLTTLTVVTSIQLKYFKDGFTLFDHTLAVTENNYVMHNNYANVLNNLERPAEAVEHFKEALRFLPDSFEVHNNYGNALKKLDRIDDAVRHYQKALKLNPKAHLTHYNLALALVAKGQYDEAIEHYKIYFGPDFEDDAHYNVATRLASEGKLAEAIEQYEKALKFTPDRVEALSNLGYAFAQKGEHSRALEYYQKALAADPNDIITHGRMALTLASIGRYDEAIEKCRIVLKARPDDAEMHTNLGILLQHQGRLDEAITCYRRALEIDPASQKARDQLNAALALK